MRAGFAKVDITPRIGVGLCGFGPFLQRRSVGVRDRLWARAAAIEQAGFTALVVSCDLIGLDGSIVERVRSLVTDATGVPGSDVLIQCTHTHSGPRTAWMVGWGEADTPYLEILPQRIAEACIHAVGELREAELLHAEVPCEGIGLNRDYDIDAPPLADVLREDWRPAKPELTDTTCHVLRFNAPNGDLIGFMSYFGCHPVVCCQETRYIHGDFVGVATGMLERERPGTIGLFLQGAQGDVNSCVVHKPERESLLALDVIASRYARAVRRGLSEAEPLAVDSVSSVTRTHTFSRKPLTVDRLSSELSEAEAVLHAAGASDESYDVRMAAVRAVVLRDQIAKMQTGESVSPPAEIHGIRIGPVALLGAPFEIFQAIKNDVVAASGHAVTLVMGLANGEMGYAPDHTTAAAGGYAPDTGPMIVGQLPYANIHAELSSALIELDAAL